jgi:hypothetical protein
VHEVEASRADKQDDCHVRQGNQHESIKAFERRCNLVCGLFVLVAQFYLAIRKLLPELQSGSQRLHENPIFRFGLSVYFDDVAFASMVSGEVVPHENTIVRPNSRLTNTSCSASVAIV